jgi:hypothetical protein
MDDGLTRVDDLCVGKIISETGDPVLVQSHRSGALRDASTALPYHPYWSSVNLGRHGQR